MGIDSVGPNGNRTQDSIDNESPQDASGLAFAGFVFCGIAVCGGIVAANRWAISSLTERVGAMETRQAIFTENLEAYQVKAEAQRLHFETSLAAFKLDIKEALLDNKAEILAAITEKKVNSKPDNSQKIIEKSPKIDELKPNKPS